MDGWMDAWVPPTDHFLSCLVYAIIFRPHLDTYITDIYHQVFRGQESGTGGGEGQ